MFGGYVKATYTPTVLKGQYIGIDDSDDIGRGGVQIGDSFHDDINIGLVYASTARVSCFPPESCLSLCVAVL